MIYGYARVSSRGQALYGTSLEEQEEQLRKAGATVIYKEAYTGTKKERPQLTLLMDRLEEGDMVIVCKLDRIARNTKAGLEIVDTIVAKGCSINILNMGTFDSTPIGRMLRTVMLAFAEFERDMIVQRTQEGREAAMEKNPDFHVGPAARNADDEYVRYYRLYRTRKMKVSEICSEMGISGTTWAKHIRRLKQAGAIS